MERARSSHSRSSGKVVGGGVLRIGMDTVWSVSVRQARRRFGSMPRRLPAPRNECSVSAGSDVHEDMTFGNFRQARARPVNRNDRMPGRPGRPRNPGHAVEEFGAWAKIAA